MDFPSYIAERKEGFYESSIMILPWLKKNHSNYAVGAV